MIKIFLLITYILFTSVEADVRDYSVSNKSKYIKNYFIIKEKEKVQYLNEVVKLTSNGTLSNSLNGNLFTINNTKLSDIAVFKLNIKDEEQILNNIDKNVIDMIFNNNNANINCESIEKYISEHNITEKNTYKISVEDCENINYKLTDFYSTNGLFSMNIPASGILAKNIDKFIINLESIYTIEFLIKNNSINTNKLIDKIAYYNVDMLKYQLRKENDSLRKSYFCRDNVIVNINTRANKLKDIVQNAGVIFLSKDELIVFLSNFLDQPENLVSNDENLFSNAIKIAEIKSTLINDLNRIIEDTGKYDCTEHMYSVGLNISDETIITDRRVYLAKLIKLYEDEIIPKAEAIFTNLDEIYENYKADLDPNDEQTAGRIAVAKIKRDNAKEDLDKKIKRKNDLRIELNNLGDS